MWFNFSSNRLHIIERSYHRIITVFEKQINRRVVLHICKCDCTALIPFANNRVSGIMIVLFIQEFLKIYGELIKHRSVLELYKNRVFVWKTLCFRSQWRQLSRMRGGGGGISRMRDTRISLVPACRISTYRTPTLYVSDFC